MLPGNKELKERTDKLSLTVLVSVSELVGSLLPEKHAKHVAYFWLKRKLGQSDIDDVLASLRKDADALKELVRDELDKAIIETQRLARETKEDTTIIKKDTSVIRQDSAAIRQDTSTIKQDSAVLKQDTSVIRQKISVIREETSIIREDTSVIRDNTSLIREDTSVIKHDTSVNKENTLYIREATDKNTAYLADLRQRLDADSRRKDEIFQRTRAEARYYLEDVLCGVVDEYIEQQIARRLGQQDIERARTPVVGIMTLPELLSAIGRYDHLEQTTDDIDRVLRLRSAIHPTAEAAAVSLLQTPAFRTWLSSSGADVILLDGAGAAVEQLLDDQAATGRVSAKSVLCASLLATLAARQPHAFRLHFFCGLHASEHDLLSDGPRGLMRSLLCDLAKEAYRRGWLNLDFIDDKTYRQGLQERRVEYLCDAFYRVLQGMDSMQALDTPVYCVVDGIAQYEQQKWLAELAVVLKMFANILSDTKLKPCFKLLLTGPHRVRYVHDMLGLPPTKRLLTRPGVSGENAAAEIGLLSGAEQMLQARRAAMVASRNGQRGLYNDDLAAADDYD
ncbi:hypothetical protein VTK56DRAFT_6427 [Thermocarpiscus australiensis]